MEEIEVRWMHAVRLWWAWLWRTMLMALPVSMAAGFVIGFMLSVSGKNVVDYEVFFQLLGMAIWTYFSITVMKKILTMSFGDFRIALIRVKTTSDKIDL